MIERCTRNPRNRAMPATRTTGQQMQAAFRRAMIAANPAYYSWTPETRERYRLALPDSEEFCIRQAILRDLFDIRVNTSEEMTAAFASLDAEQNLIFSSAILPAQGMGDDLFFLNEYLGEKTLLDYKTVYDYDYDDYCCQMRFCQEDDPNYVIRSYQGELYYCWARLQIDGAFSYAFLCMASSYLHGLLQRIGEYKIEELIPHRYVDGKNHGKREGSSTVWDQRPDANGKEAHLHELKDRYYHYIEGRIEAASNDFDAAARKRVYLVDRSQRFDPHMDFVFTDKDVLQEVRFRHFMADCRQRAGDNRELDAFLARERRSALEFLERNCRDILEHFDPQIARFRRKVKITISDRFVGG